MCSFFDAGGRLSAGLLEETGSGPLLPGEGLVVGNELFCDTVRVGAGSWISGAEEQAVRVKRIATNSAPIYPSDSFCFLPSVRPAQQSLSIIPQGRKQPHDGKIVQIEQQRRFAEIKEHKLVL